MYKSNQHRNRRGCLTVFVRAMLLSLILIVSFITQASAYDSYYLELREDIWTELHLQFNAHDRNKIKQRRNRLQQLFSQIPATKGKIFYEELGRYDNGGEFSEVFHARLDPFVCAELLNILEHSFTTVESVSDHSYTVDSTPNVVNKTYSNTELLVIFDSLVRKAVRSCDTYYCLVRIVEVIAVAECKGKRFCSMKSSVDGGFIFNNLGKGIVNSVNNRYALELSQRRLELDQLYPRGSELSIPIPKSQRLNKSPNKIAMEQLDILRGSFFASVIYSGLNPNYESNKHEKAQSAAKFMDSIFSFRGDLTKTNSSQIIRNR